MKRYPSIDFLRGFAIFLMVFLHTFMRWFDQDAFIEKINNGAAPLALVLLMVILLFLGSWAGFFLMVSAIGNMISMYKALSKGQDVRGLVMKQVIGGFLLLFFAYMVEGVIGYHGWLGELLVGNYDLAWSNFWSRGWHMETIHAVAWCVILNGIVQGILSKNGGFKKINRNIKIYAILAIIVIILTQFVWWGFDAMVADGDFSHGTNPATGNSWQYGHWLNLDVFTNILLIFVQPWAGQVEPLFPFLAVSFIGSILGLYLMKREEQPQNIDTKPLKRGMLIGLLMTIVGLVIVVAGLLMMQGDPLDNVLGLLATAYDMTGIEGRFGWVWIPYFILITGAQLGAILLVLRLVEFRGKSEPFAKRTLFFRRFGFVAFTIYSYQFLDVIVIFLLSFIPGFPAYSMKSYNEIQIWVVIVGILLLWHIVLSLWERVDYALGLEWMIAKISTVIIPVKRSIEKEYLPWWKTQRLDPQASLHNAEWIGILTSEQIDHANLKESKLAFKLALCGFIFFPCFFLSISIAKSSMITENENKYNKRAKLIGLIFSVLTLIIFGLLSVLTTSLVF